LNSTVGFQQIPPSGIIEKTHFVKGAVVVKSIEYGFEFDVSAEMIRFVFGFYRVESVRFLSTR